MKKYPDLATLVIKKKFLIYTMEKYFKKLNNADTKIFLENGNSYLKTYAHNQFNYNYSNIIGIIF